MKIRNLFFTTILIFLQGVLTIYAQEVDLTEKQEIQLENQLELFNEKLNLNNKQKLEFKAITKKYLPQLIELRVSNESKIKKIKAFQRIIKNRNNQMKMLLNQEQFRQYKLIVKQEIQKKIRLMGNKKN